MTLTSVIESKDGQTIQLFQVEVFSVVTPCSVVVGYQRFRGPYCLHLQGGVKMEAAWTSETLISYHNLKEINLNFHRRESLKFRD
jgi:hypothetical protein